MRKKSTSGGSEFQKPGRQVAYQRGNQREGSPHYVFLYSEDDQSEDEVHFPMKVKNSTQNLPRKIEVINVQIQSDDTLQALALRYRCTISELKRINNIHKDNEIHAHQSIKVPVQPYSLLTEIPLQSNENCPINEQDTNVKQANETASKENQIINLLAIPVPSTSTELKINDIILNSTVEPLSQFNHESSELLEESETDQLINPTEYKISTSNNIVNTFKCSGADWGLSWFQLVCVSLLLGFAGPIIYVLYIAESTSKHHNSSFIGHNHNIS